jgi:hypothetical protein
MTVGLMDRDRMRSQARDAGLREILLVSVRKQMEDGLTRAQCLLVNRRPSINLR